MKKDEFLDCLYSYFCQLELETLKEKQKSSDEILEHLIDTFKIIKKSRQKQDEAMKRFNKIRDLCMNEMDDKEFFENVTDREDYKEEFKIRLANI